MGSVCIRNTNILQTPLNNYKESNSLTSNIMQYNDIFISNDSMNVNDRQWIVENRDDIKWHDDLIYS
jgi:hypothetical protein